MKTLATIVVLALCAPIPAMALDELPDDETLWEQAPQYLPNATVPQPALAPPAATELEPVVAKALGVNRTTFSASSSVSTGSGSYATDSFRWTSQRRTAELQIVARPSVSRLIDQRVGAGQVSKRGQATVVRRKGTTEVYLPLSGKRLVSAFVPGKPTRAEPVALRAVRVLKRRASGIPKAYEDHVRANATVMLAWSYVAIFNELPAYLDDQRLDFPDDPTALWATLGGFRNAGLDPARYATFTYGLDNCVQIRPRRGATSPTVHMLFDTSFGGGSQVLSLDSGPCPAPVLATPPDVSIQRPPAVPKRAVAIGQWLGRASGSPAWRYNADGDLTGFGSGSGRGITMSTWSRGRQSAMLYSMDPGAASVNSGGVSAARLGTHWIVTGPVGATKGAMLTVRGVSKRAAISLFDDFVKRARSFPAIRRAFTREHATSASALLLAQYSSQARFTSGEQMTTIPDLGPDSPLHYVTVRGSGSCLTVTATREPAQAVSLALSTVGQHVLVKAVTAGACPG